MYRNHMKTLFILRHGEAEPNFNNHNDFFRKLNVNGEKQLLTLKPKLKSVITSIDLVLVSSSLRTLGTFELLRNLLKPKRIKILDELYACDSLSIFSILQSLAPEIENVMLIGHNPALSNFISEITDAEYFTMSPANLAHLNIIVSEWNMLGRNTATLIGTYI